jgi:hypothetical protein
MDKMGDLGKRKKVRKRSKIRKKHKNGALKRTKVIEKFGKSKKNIRKFKKFPVRCSLFIVG